MLVRHKRPWAADMLNYSLLSLLEEGRSTTLAGTIVAETTANLNGTGVLIFGWHGAPR